MALFMNYLELFFNFDTNFIFFVFEKNYYVIILYKYINK